MTTDVIRREFWEAMEGRRIHVLNFPISYHVVDSAELVTKVLILAAARRVKEDERYKVRRKLRPISFLLEFIFQWH